MATESHPITLREAPEERRVGRTSIPFRRLCVPVFRAEKAEPERLN